MDNPVRVAIIGAGPAGLMMFSKLLEVQHNNFEVDIFESSGTLGSGMPYSPAGALKEHVTNVSSDELPELSKLLEEWVLQQSDEVLAEFDINRSSFHEKQVVPRLLFGQYLKSQFEKMLSQARDRALEVTVHLNTKVIDVIQNVERKVTVVVFEDNKHADYNRVIICTGHHWQIKHEKNVAGYYDSPYPPAKLVKHFNHKVVVRGSSLTAIDAIKTAAKSNGKFYWEGDVYKYKRNPESPNFSIEMHSRDGLLPSVRVHMEEPHVDSKALIEQNKLDENMRANDGFLELDFIYNEAFKNPLAESDPAFYQTIKDKSMEEFVDNMMSYRESMSAFDLMRKEYNQSLESIEKERPVPWKEMLGALSFALNYPAKHMSAEDMLRLRQHLQPLISVVIAFVPQNSCETLLALHDAGCLELITDGHGGDVCVEDGKIIYKLKDESGKVNENVCETFIDCIGQKHLNIDDFPFKSLLKNEIISGARLKFRSAEKAKELQAGGEKGIECEDGIYYMRVPGVTIDDAFRVLDKAGHANDQLYLMAVPHIGGFNPDYSGLDFCEQASKKISAAMFQAADSKQLTAASVSKN